MSHPRNENFDSADQFFLGRQLETLRDPTRFYPLIPGLIGRTFIPPIDGVTPEMDSYSYEMLHLVGATRRGNGRGRGRGARTVDVRTSSHSSRIATIDTAASWTLDEVRKARKLGSDLPGIKMMTAVSFIEQRFDELLAVGDSVAGVVGLANHPGVASQNATAAWSGATAAQILADVESIIENTNTALKQGQVFGKPGSPKFNQWVLALPAKYETKFSFRRIDSTLEATIGKFIRENAAKIKQVVWWHQLDTADGGNPMGVLAPALDNGAINPMAGGAVMPLDFESLPEQYSGRQVTVHCSGKCGGFVTPYPVAFRYLKGM